MLLVMIMMIGLALSAALASSKNRNVMAWGICGALFPLITIIVLLASAPVPLEQNGAA